MGGGGSMCNSLVPQSKFLSATVGSQALVAAGRAVPAVAPPQIVACSSPASPPVPAATLRKEFR